MNTPKFAIVGAGFSGAILANELAKDGYQVTVYESRNHIGGNCFTERDTETGIMIHEYGPHIFHTDNERVWTYVNNLVNFKSFINRVKTTTNNKVFSLPINLHTINQFFDKTFNPKEAQDFINSIGENKIDAPNSFEEQALKFVGKDLYNAFFKEYTLKQWGVHPTKLPSSILKRLPVRFNYDDNYFNHKYQGIPENGYTPIFEKLLNHENIHLLLSTKFLKNKIFDFNHVFYTGPIDAWFNYEDGRLGYRTLDFQREVHEGDFQGCAVMNYPDINVPFTRITEHKHFSPWESPKSKTVIFKEFSRDCDENDIPYYPIRLVNEKKLLMKYISKAMAQNNVSFLGRLGTYRYLDMDVTISEALQASDIVKSNLQKGELIPAFFVDQDLS
jgi:UDP-galactopyranose mutase